MKKKVYLGGMNILSIILSLEPGCHNEDGLLLLCPGSHMCPSGASHLSCCTRRDGVPCRRR
jgi:hypothetical protein